MSKDKRTDGQYAQRRYLLEESITTTDGARTTFIEYMTPGTQVPPHYHKLFSETFDLISGPMTVYSSVQPHDQEADLEALERSATEVKVAERVIIEPTVYHQYRVGDADAVLRVILTPGHANFERLLKILDGLAEDGQIEQMSANPLLMAIVMDLADSYLLGPAKSALDTVRNEKREEIEELRKELLAKYDTDAVLQRLMRQD